MILLVRNKEWFVVMNRDKADGKLSWNMNHWDEKIHSTLRESEMAHIFKETNIRLQEEDLIYVGGEHYANDVEPGKDLRETVESDENAEECANFICIVKWDGENGLTSVRLSMLARG
jgi:hypothetical protein